MIKEIEHIAVCSAYTKVLCDWYVDVLGMKMVYDNGKCAYFVAASDASMIEIINQTEEAIRGDMQMGGIRHFALAVDNDEFEPVVDKIRATGCKILQGQKKRTE